MSPFPTRERKAVSPTPPRQNGDAADVSEPGLDFQPESGALAPCEPTDEAQLEHDRRDDL